MDMSLGKLQELVIDKEAWHIKNSPNSLLNKGMKEFINVNTQAKVLDLSLLHLPLLLSLKKNSSLQ